MGRHDGHPKYLTKSCPDCQYRIAGDASMTILARHRFPREQTPIYHDPRTVQFCAWGKAIKVLDGKPIQSRMYRTCAIRNEAPTGWTHWLSVLAAKGKLPLGWKRKPSTVTETVGPG